MEDLGDSVSTQGGVQDPSDAYGQNPYGNGQNPYGLSLIHISQMGTAAAKTSG